MTTEETLGALDDLIRERCILQHPFCRAWQRGELTSIRLPPTPAFITRMSQRFLVILKTRLTAPAIRGSDLRSGKIWTTRLTNQRHPGYGSISRLRPARKDKQSNVNLLPKPTRSRRSTAD